MRKLLTFLMLFVSISTFSFSQTQTPTTTLATKVVKRIGLQAGFSMAKNVYFADGATEFNDEMSNLPAFNVGFYTEQGKSQYFTTQFGLFYQKKGTKGDGGYSLSLDYIQVPLTWNIRMPIAGPVFMKLGIGPYAAYAFNGKMKVDQEGTVMDLFSLPQKNANENKMLSPFDFGIVFGGQVEYVLPDKRTIELSFKYDMGVSKISNDFVIVDGAEPSNLGIKNRVLSFNLVYSFNLSKVE